MIWPLWGSPYEQVAESQGTKASHFHHSTMSTPIYGHMPQGPQIFQWLAHVQGHFIALNPCEWSSPGIPSHGSDKSYPTAYMPQAHIILNAIGIICPFT